MVVTSKLAQTEEIGIGDNEFGMFRVKGGVVEV